MSNFKSPEKKPLKRGFSTYNSLGTRHTHYFEMTYRCGLFMVQILRPTPSGNRGPVVAATSLTEKEAEKLIAMMQVKLAKFRKERERAEKKKAKSNAV